MTLGLLPAAPQEYATSILTKVFPPNDASKAEQLQVAVDELREALKFFRLISGLPYERTGLKAPVLTSHIKFCEEQLPKVRWQACFRSAVAAVAAYASRAGFGCIAVHSGGSITRLINKNLNTGGSNASLALPSFQKYISFKGASCHLGAFRYVCLGPHALAAAETSACDCSYQAEKKLEKARAEHTLLDARRKQQAIEEERIELQRQLQKAKAEALAKMVRLGAGMAGGPRSALPGAMAVAGIIYSYT